MIALSSVVLHLYYYAFIRNGSATTWKHFNLHGEFDFSDERMVDSIGLELSKNLDMELV